MPRVRVTAMRRYAVATLTCPTAGLLASLVLVLLLSAAVADDNSFCKKLEEKTAERASRLGWRRVSYNGRAVNVSLLWGSASAHAAAALLAVHLRYVRRYHGVCLPRERTAFSTNALAANVTFKADGNYSEFLIDLSTVWEPKPTKWVPLQGRAYGLAGPRLVEFGQSRVPTWRYLHAWLAPHVRTRTSCTHHVQWTFYDNSTLENCDFVDPEDPQGNALVVYVFGEDDCEAMLHQCANMSMIPIRVERRSRVDFKRTLQGDGHSFLFLDYDMWHPAPGVSVVNPPPCDSNNFDCKLELDNAAAVRVADTRLLETFAPQLFKFAFDFQPPLEALKLILERQARGVDIEEAACEWVLENKGYNISDEDKRTYDVIPYDMLVFLCGGVSENNIFKILLNIVQKELEKHTVPQEWNLSINPREIDCLYSDSMSGLLEDYSSTATSYRLLGAVFLSAEGTMAEQASSVAVEASTLADTNHVPLVFAGVVSEEGTATSHATWRLSPRPRHIARALLHFVRKSNWTRVAVLSQRTKLAQEYYDALKHETEIVLTEFPIYIHMTKERAQKPLQKLRDVNARIVFVNADSEAASTILTAAVAARMRYADGFVWILRDWQQKEVTCRTEHFTVSSWIRGVEDIPPEGNASLYAMLNDVRLGQPWPPRTVSLVDALVSLVISYKDVFQRFPNMKQDLRNVEIIQFLKESLIRTPVSSVSQELRFKERSLEEMIVFVNQWCGGNITQRLASWHVNATDGAVRCANLSHASYTPSADLPLDDGALRCYWRTGDAFWPTCYDVTCAVTVVILVLVLAAALLVRRAVRRHFARLLQEQQIQVIARRRHVAAVLARYLVDRTALELHKELGAGRFGSVRLARLREPGRAPRYIAAKALRESASAAEESDFLREACTIASLEHPHIVRLVGVCIEDGPPLVLMELAFFGDLSGYLRARRHLVDDGGSEAALGEAEHVSAAALTRLAREAAEALQYLAERGVVHRDVRAANCLVDERRSLKLADFGMARDTVSGEDGAPEYACRRRGMFPVLWMAPESLEHGVFSAASDVWALGVLLLELVTLGARPYGAMSPLRVLEYVAAGGCPSLPIHATPQTRGLARLCWARAAERRPSAAEVAAYLAARPLVLRPAPLNERDKLTDVDSGFGESPSIELLPRDSPVHSLDQLDGLAATH